MGEVFASKGVSAQVVEHTISPCGIEILSFGLTGHRYILAEVDTHRVFSRSFRSSRAVPVPKMISEVRNNPMMPVVWRKNRPGMQAYEDMTELEAIHAERVWREAARIAADYAQYLTNAGLHKQWANRGLEAYLPFQGIVTSVYWQNYYALRNHPDAMPDFKLLAELMLEAHRASEPTPRKHGEWHMPYIDEEDDAKIYEYCLPIARKQDLDAYIIETSRYVSGARCARSSFKMFDEDRKPTVKEDLDLAARLIKDGHWSPFEHQATPARFEGKKWVNQDLLLFGNFYGYIQSRKMFPKESRSYEIYPMGHPRRETTWRL